jgi:hypothetical protein
MLLFAAERTVVPAERLGRALGAPMRVLPDRGEFIVEIESTPCHRSFPRSHLARTRTGVLTIKTVVDRLCEGTLRGEEARPALVLAGNLPPVSLRRLEMFTGAGRRRRWSETTRGSLRRSWRAATQFVQ